jgi:hypothetical protein
MPMSDTSPRTPPADDPDPPPDEADLVAYLDGELDPDESRAVESKLALDPTARASADALKKTYDLLDYLPRPEPSPNFTQRTLTRIDLPAAAPSSPAVPVTGSPQPGRHSRRAAWVAAGLLAAVGGYFVHALVPPGTATESPDLAFSDVRVIENLPLYLGVDDLGFLRRLDEADLFPPEPGDAGGSARPAAATEPVPAARRDELTRLFRSFPAVRQQQLRQIDSALHDLGPPTRENLADTLERYAVWLDRLPDPDRTEVLSAPSPAERLDAVRRVKLRAWRGALPASYRARLDAVKDVDDLTRQIAELRKQEADRRAAWELARRQWDAFKRESKPWPFSDDKLAGEIDQYARTVLRPRLAGPEQVAFDRLRQDLAQDAGPEGKWFMWVLYGWYGSRLVEWSDRHPMLPEYGNGNRTVKAREDLPPEFIQQMNRAAGQRKPLQSLPGGRWPEFAEAVAKEAKDLRVPVEFPIGPSRPGEFTPAVNEFLKTLRGKSNRREWDSLRQVEGKWPDYPKRMIELAAAHDLSVPGVTLPGSPRKWAELYRTPRGKK